MKKSTTKGGKAPARTTRTENPKGMGTTVSGPSNPADTGVTELARHAADQEAMAALIK